MNDRETGAKSAGAALGSGRGECPAPEGCGEQAGPCVHRRRSSSACDSRLCTAGRTKVPLPSRSATRAPAGGPEEPGADLSRPG